MEKKYELTDETIIIEGKTLHRIKALRDFGNVDKGDLGGFVEKEGNLSHKGKCWIYNNAKVFDDAEVYGDARVYGNAEVSYNAQVYGHTEVYGHACVFDNAWVCGYAHIYGHACVCGNARVFDNARLYGYARVSGNAWVYGYARVSGNARVYGNACVYDSMRVIYNANVKSENDICSISSFGSSNRCTTFFRCEDGEIRVKCGCFEGTLDEFREKVKETHGDNKYGREYLTIVDAIEIKFSK